MGPIAKLLVLTSAILLASPLGCAAERPGVVVLPLPFGTSHQLVIGRIAQELASRDYRVLLVMRGRDQKAVAQAGVLDGLEVATWQSDAEMTLNLAQGAKRQSAYERWDGITSFMNGQCDALFANATLMQRMQDFGAGLVLADTMFPCNQLVAAALHAPSVTVQCGPYLDPQFGSTWTGSYRAMGAPNPLALIPQLGTGHANPMHAGDRNSRQDMHLNSLWELARRRRHGFDPRTIREQARQGLTLISADFAVEPSRNLPPNIKFVGPIMPRPARPLPADFQEFMDSASETGVVVVSTGTVITTNMAQHRAMAAAFLDLPAKVLWRLSTKEANDSYVAALGLGSNVKVVRWVPQNDVLGHRNARAFLTHGGSNSLYEAAYHGVPLIGMAAPIADQLENVGKAVRKGFAVRLQGEHSTDAARVRAAVMEALSHPRYAAAAAAVSCQLRARPRTPVQEAADWVQHALATDGAPHLKPPGHGVPFVARHNLDIAAAEMALAVAALIAARRIALGIWRAIGRRTRVNGAAAAKKAA